MTEDELKKIEAACRIMRDYSKEVLKDMDVIEKLAVTFISKELTEMGLLLGHPRTGRVLRALLNYSEFIEGLAKENKK